MPKLLNLRDFMSCNEILTISSMPAAAPQLPATFLVLVLTHWGCKPHFLHVNDIALAKGIISNELRKSVAYFCRRELDSVVTSY